MGWWRASMPPIDLSPAFTAARTDAAMASRLAWRSRAASILSPRATEWSPRSLMRKRRNDPLAASRTAASGDEGRRQAIPRRRRAQEYRLRPPARRNSRHPWRERRREIDAGQNPLWRSDADARRNSSQWAGDPDRQPFSRAALWHCDGLPRDEPCSQYDGRAEPLSRRREVLQSPPRDLYRRTAIPAVAELSCRSYRDGSIARHRQAADGRDRARGSPQGESHHLRRTYSDADAGGKASSFRADQPATEGSGFDYFHQPCIGGSARNLRPDHDSARRRSRHNGRGQVLHPRNNHPPHGGPIAHKRALWRRRRASCAAAARRQSPHRAKPVD